MAHSVVPLSSNFGSPYSLFARRMQKRKRSRVYQPHARRFQSAQSMLQFQKSRRPDLFFRGSEKAHAPSLATIPRGGVCWRTRGIECGVGRGHMRVRIEFFCDGVGARPKEITTEKILCRALPVITTYKSFIVLFT